MMGTRETIAALAAGFEPIDAAYDPASEQDLLMAEVSLGAKLPELFREIQKAYGRCRFAGEALIPVKGAEPLGVATIFGCKGASGNLLLEYQAQPGLQAQGRVPIADDGRNNRYVWDAATGGVLFIDATHGKPPLWIAPTFEAFLNEIWVGPNH
jgi:hypothetical protein